MDDMWKFGSGNQSWGASSNDFNLGGSGNNFNTVGYTPSYSGSDDFNVGGSGGSGGNFNTVGYNPSTSAGAWWDAPAGGNGYTPSVGYTPSFTPSFTLGAGSSGAGQNVQGNFGQATASGGNFGGVTVGAGGGGGTFTAAPVQGNAGVAGGFGVDPREYSLGGNNERAGAPAAEQTPSALSRGASAVGQGLSRVGEYAQKNPWAARLAVDAAGLGLGYLNQRNANKLAQEQMQMQRDAQSRNDARANFWNQQSTQSANEARSLYNPQEMGVRAMATQQGRTQNAMDTAAQQMRSRGMSQAAIDAEMRRARIGGSTGAATAYTQGLDTGRAAQQSALTSAKGLGMDSNFTANYGGAEAASKAGAMTTKQLQDLLNTYLRNPVGRTNAQIIDDQQRETGQ
jgi:hypothetical protein